MVRGMANARRRRRHRVAIIVLVSFCVLLVGASGVAYYLGQRLVAPIDRIDGVFDGLENRPPKPTHGPAADAVNILLLGTDRRSDVPTTGDNARADAWVPGAQRADAMLLVHIDGDRSGASVISFPRDSWVDLPHRGYDKINAAYSYGGPSLAVETVEKLTQVRIDHLAVIDWAGIRALTDAMGGVDVTVPETVYDSARDITWTAGEHHLDGQEALNYVGQRHGLPNGDLDRTKRQQNYLRIVMGDALSRLSGDGIWDVYKLLRVMTSNVSVDAEWGTKAMASLAWSLRDLDDANVAFLNAPVSGLGYEGAASVVYLDRPACSQLWSAVRADEVGKWLKGHQDALLTDTVR
jgi:LCP family protein required for cell wall assembly